MSTVLVVGSGGREHALAWKLSQSPQVTRVIVAPGNVGMGTQFERWPVSLAEGRFAFEKLAQRSRDEKVDLLVVGPDNALADGIVDCFEEYGIRAFGPTAAAAQIEASKSFAKDIMISAGIPTAQYRVAQTEEEARKILKSVPWPPAEKHAPGGWVLKADGLALGKGVRVCENREEALQALPALASLSGKIVIEEKLSGEELSWLAFCDGEDCALLEPARDYKRLKDGNLGPNTGGMGAYSPVSCKFTASPKTEERIRNEVFLPALREMKRRGIPFRGVLYAGLMVNPDSGQYWVLEFNARFGDPETQVLMPRIDGDLYSWCDAVARGDLSRLPSRVPFKKEAAVVVVAASAGYPEQPVLGKSLEQPTQEDSAPDSRLIFYAGVKESEKGWATSGGRVLGAVGLGSDLAAARQEAYQNLKRIHFEGMQFRADVGV